MAGVITAGCRLYIITPERLDLYNFPDLLARALDAGEPSSSG
jgi:hypothetical protein